MRVATPWTYRRAAAARHAPAEAAAGAMPDAWEPWFRRASPGLADFAPHHVAAGAWLEAIRPGAPRRPALDVWPRGHGKSTFAEVGTAYLGETGRRAFVLYLCDTQDAANRHVGAIQSVLERLGGPIGERLENEYGHSKGWQKSMLRTAAGFNVLGLGFDVALRGIKLDEFRPDLIIFDDIDGRHDTAATTKKKAEVLTESILPAGAPHLVVWGVQNLIQPHGIVSRLVDGRADFLADIDVRGPVRAVEGLVTEDAVDPASGRRYKRITGGRATWAGCDLATCQREIKDFGWRAFDREKQQNVKDVEGALWTSALLNDTRADAAPPLSRVVVAIDPATTSKASSDATGIGAIGRTADGHGYVLADETGTYTPAEWGRRAVRLRDRVAAEHGCPDAHIVAESNQGGEMVQDVIENAAKALHAEGARLTPHVRVELVHASKGKRARAEPVAQQYEEAAIHHVGDLPALEEEMTTWDASDGSESPNRVDWLVWGAHALGLVKTDTWLLS